MPVSTSIAVVKEETLDFVTMSLLSNGIVIYRYHADIELDMPKVKLMMKAAHDLTNGKVAPHCAILGNGMSATKDVLEYGKTKEATEFTSASAIVLQSFAHRIIGNFFVKSGLKKSPIPFKLFNDEDSAMEWLQQFCD